MELTQNTHTHIRTNGIESIAPTKTDDNHRATKAPPPYRRTVDVSYESNCMITRKPSVLLYKKYGN